MDRVRVLASRGVLDFWTNDRRHVSQVRANLFFLDRRFSERGGEATTRKEDCRPFVDGDLAFLKLNALSLLDVYVLSGNRLLPLCYSQNRQSGSLLS